MIKLVRRTWTRERTRTVREKYRTGDIEEIAQINRHRRDSRTDRQTNVINGYDRDTETVTETETETETEPEAETQAETEPETITEPEPETETETETETDTDTDRETEAGSETEYQTEPEAETQTQTETEPSTGSRVTPRDAARAEVVDSDRYVLARVLPLVEETGYEPRGLWSPGHLMVRLYPNSVRP